MFHLEVRSQLIEANCWFLQGSRIQALHYTTIIYNTPKDNLYTAVKIIQRPFPYSQ